MNKSAEPFSSEILQVHIPTDNFGEREYIIRSILGDFLGLTYDLIASEGNIDYTIQFGPGKIIFKDDFFLHFKEPLTYRNINNIPETVSWLDPSPYFNENLPVIFGDNTIREEGDQIFVGLDIFASSFFMLTRWEETVIDKKDIFNRCAESEMFVVRHNLFKRPIVNEYVSFLKSLLIHLNCNILSGIRKFEVCITHDVDYLFRFGSLFSLGKNLGGDLLLRKSLRTAGRTILNYGRFKKGIIRDPFDTFDELMDLSEKYSLKSSFYFKPQLLNEYDATYSIQDERVKKIILNINQREHEVGIHPSFNTFNNPYLFRTEYNRLTSIGIPVEGGRQHFLKYDLTETPRYWEEAGLKYDCGLGFSEGVGFRCGICWPFKMFDIKRRKILKLYQKPLCVMEVALTRWEPAPEKLFADIQEILNQVKKHSGLFVLLWHNDSFNRPEYENYREVYSNVLKSI
jgi:hypothetical protein